MTWMSGSGPVTRLTISRSIHGIARRTTLSVFDTGVSHLETPNDGPDAGGGNHGRPDNFRSSGPRWILLPRGRLEESAEKPQSAGTVEPSSFFTPQAHLRERCFR
jgi:hypothetical protein